MLKAFSLVIKKINAKLLIIGKGKLKNYLQDFILKEDLSNYVKLIGYTKNPYNFLNCSDLFVLSSKFEGLPNVLLEAQFLKKYIISSNCPTGPKEILLNGKAGDLFRIGDYKKLAKLICDYKAKDLKIRKMIKLGFDNFYRFDLEYNCQEYHKILKHYL